MESVLTRNEHSLAAHDKDDLHRSELLHVELAPHMDSESQLDDKDSGEEGNGHDGDDVVSLGHVPKKLELLCGRTIDAENVILNVEHGQGEADGQRSEGDDGRHDDDADLSGMGQGAADNTDLQDKRAVDEGVDDNA